MQSATHNQVTNIYLADVIEAFIIDRRAYNAAPGTIQFYRGRLGLFQRYCTSQSISKINEIHSAVIRTFLLWMEETGHNSGGRNACYRTLRTLFYWLEQEQDGFISPTRKVKAPKLEQTVIEGISPEDIQLLLSTCDGKYPTDRRDKALLLFLIDTGARISECLGIDLDDINFPAGSVLIRKGKGRKSRTVFFGKITRRAINAYLNSRGDKMISLWVDRFGERLTYNGVRESLRRRSKIAGLPEIPSPHDFRRAFALSMLRNGCDLITLQRLMGHTDLTVLHRYLAQVDGDLQTVYVRTSPVDHLK